MSSEIPKIRELEQRIFGLDDEAEFEDISLQVFRFQYASNPIYQEYCKLLKCAPAMVNRLEDIPFLPISFFKTHDIRSGGFEPEAVFESSGTTGSVNSRHAVKSLDLYRRSFMKGFEAFYGGVNQYCVLALLPSYLERQNSSLVYMVKEWMEESSHPANAFYLDDRQALARSLQMLENDVQQTILVGVTYALLDFAESYPMSLNNTIIMETGGMKGRREELLRTEVHNRLKAAFGVSGIHSEYGMTELLSQAYAIKEGKFRTPPWMKILVREENDPKQLLRSTPKSASGGLNVIDLANLYGCSFIATEDVCRLLPDGSFEVLGRLDHTDIRGCSLLSL